MKKRDSQWFLIDSTRGKWGLGKKNEVGLEVVDKLNWAIDSHNKFPCSDFPNPTIR